MAPIVIMDIDNWGQRLKEKYFKNSDFYDTACSLPKQINKVVVLISTSTACLLVLYLDQLSIMKLASFNVCVYIYMHISL